MDTVGKNTRSKMMAAVKQSDTAGELAVRSLLHRLGYRFRLHRRDLPGTPDLVLPRYRTAVFVHGCFWHAHQGCRQGRPPTTNVDYWNAKRQENRERDRRVIDSLGEDGWRVIVVWECELKHEDILAARLDRELRGSAAQKGGSDCSATSHYDTGGDAA